MGQGTLIEAPKYGPGAYRSFRILQNLMSSSELRVEVREILTGFSVGDTKAMGLAQAHQIHLREGPAARTNFMARCHVMSKDSCVNMGRHLYL
jgi:hypothetical protein